ncbi:MAG: nickel pincer cofactor biosynthesis protein LarB [Eubacteriales bacterium]|nr:nickel pincer cofactor biosynthesis protein LarB [Eubacteriales bacterium]
MESEALRSLLQAVKQGQVDVDRAMEELKDFSYEDIGYANIDHHRSLRTGYPEVIYCAGKTPEQIAGIVSHMMAHDSSNILATRANDAAYDAVRAVAGDAAEYRSDARIIMVHRKEVTFVNEKRIAVITGGTSDIPVAEEAALTAEFMGNHVERIFDVGVAGLHRLLSRLELIRSCNVLITVAGMEGALASVVAGLVDKPVIAVPTSVGYGASFGGLSALLTMLNSCASGVSVVNIDNGFGAGFLAAMINKL